ncbi:MmgE/PrpD family protein [Sphingomonas sp.]|uniref:MmgE/PrpD family protein n=1 Tax=Sphingomonas sp. TaxID=28214 RepID=UPI001B2A89B3|nr:MmgE/PrpD family protein [Sphingomonas sp.]MBO9714585.1 MmgE/PrpD family protein [Sphingomonas sp.]
MSARIAAHVADFPAEALPRSTLHAAKRALLDGLGVMLAASGESPEVRPFVAYAAANGEGRASILGHGLRVSAEMAAFANGAMAHALDFEDAFDAAPSHPDAALLPAALAIAEAHGPVHGRDLLAAIAVGCDLVCRLGLSLRREMEAGGWYPPPILGAFGAVAAAARLRRLDAGQARDAFSLMLCQAVMPGEIKYSRDTVIRAIREAFPAQAAVKAAALARAGVRGFEAPFEGKAGFFRLFAESQFDPAAILDGLGEHFWIEQLTLKRWPACRGTHAYIEAVQALRATHGLAPEQIARITAIGGDVQRMLVEPAEQKRSPATVIDAKFSIPYTIAAALLDPEVTLESFAPDLLADPERRRLAALVDYEQRPDWGRDRAASGGLRVQLRDGRTLKYWVEIAAGHPSAPLSDEALTAKFLDCAARANRPFAPGEAEALAAAIWSLDTARDSGATLVPI